MGLQAILCVHDKCTSSHERCLRLTNPILHQRLILQHCPGTPGSFRLSEFDERVDGAPANTQRHRRLVIDRMCRVSIGRIFPGFTGCQRPKGEEVFGPHITVRHAHIVAAGATHACGVPGVDDFEFADRYHVGGLRGFAGVLIDG